MRRWPKPQQGLAGQGRSRFRGTPPGLTSAAVIEEDSARRRPIAPVGGSIELGRSLAAGRTGRGFHSASDRLTVNWCPAPECFFNSICSRGAAGLGRPPIEASSAAATTSQRVGNGKRGAAHRCWA